VPRPYVIQPPLDGKTDYAPGETLRFGLTMFARALNLFPYVVLAMQRLERSGLGKRIVEPCEGPPAFARGDEERSAFGGCGQRIR